MHPLDHLHPLKGNAPPEQAVHPLAGNSIKTRYLFHKRTVILIEFLFITILLILAAVVVAVFQFTQFGYLTTVPYRSAFTRIASHVYINRNYAGDRQELLEMIEQAKDRVRTFFGDVLFQDKTVFIICDDEKLTQKLGEDHGTVILSFSTEAHYICMMVL